MRVHVSSYTAIVFHDSSIRRVVVGLKRRHAFKFRSLVRDRGFRWDVWLYPESPPSKKSQKNVNL